MDGIRLWSRSIVVSVIITVVIEMILPENNSKKYIKIVIGIFVVYSIISPVFEFFSTNSVDKIIDKSEAVVEASTSNLQYDNNVADNAESSIMSIYSQSLKNEIQSILQNNGYTAENIEVVIANDNTYNINQVSIKITEKKEETNPNKQAQSIVETVKQIVINCDNSNKSEKNIIDEGDKSKIKKVIHDNFGVAESRININ